MRVPLLVLHITAGTLGMLSGFVAISSAEVPAGMDSPADMLSMPMRKLDADS